MRKPSSEQANFAPADVKVCHAIAEAVGVDLAKALGASLEFVEPGLTVLVVRYHVDSAAMARVLSALQAMGPAE